MEKSFKKDLKGYQRVSSIDIKIFMREMDRSRYKIISGTWVFREIARDPKSNVVRLLRGEIMNTEVWANRYEELQEMIVKVIRETVE